jgi:acyl-CoA thioesterase
MSAGARPGVGAFARQMAALVRDGTSDGDHGDGGDSGARSDGGDGADGGVGAAGGDGATGGSGATGGGGAAGGSGDGAAGRPGRYRAEVAAHWNCPLFPQGGLVAAVAAQAIAIELDAPDQRLRSLTTLFVQPVPAGPVTVDVGVVRRGRSMSQASATLAPEGATTGQTAVAVFGRSRPGFAFTDRVMPEAPPPHECRSVRDPFPEGFEAPEIQFWNHVDSRIASGHLPWDDYMPASSDMVLWYRYDEAPRDRDGVLDPLALVALCDTMPSSINERLGPDRPDWWGPSADLTVHLLAESRSDWILAHLRTRRAADGYASAEIELWDTDAGLVAYGTQVMFFTFAGGPPPPELLVPRDQRVAAPAAAPPPRPPDSAA